jgi:ADP-ribosylglycohydrolase
MTGAIAGSYSGFASIPKGWIRTIDTSSKTNIRKLARDLLDVSEH